jgi:hypothetical protein
LTGSVVERLDYFSIVAALIAALALIRFKLGVIPVLFASAVCGLVWRTLIIT